MESNVKAFIVIAVLVGITLGFVVSSCLDKNALTNKPNCINPISGGAVRCVDSPTDKGVKICTLYSTYLLGSAQDCNLQCDSICTNFCGAKGLNANSNCQDTVEVKGNECVCDCY